MNGRWTRQQALSGLSCLAGVAGGLLRPSAAPAQGWPSPGGRDEAGDPLAPLEGSLALDFDRVRLHQGEDAGTFLLTVAGIMPVPDLRVRLVPLVYVRQPEYWGIAAVGLRSGAAPAAPTPYTASLILERPLGTRGIEVIGATRSQRLDLAPPPLPGLPVIAEGTLQRQEITAYQYGTHVLHGPTVYALRSTSVDLDAYVGQPVRVAGSPVPGYPIEGGPPYLDVESVQPL